ncbi:hypothetical protein ASZ90_006728 [hydrocarbon metagenome]|uniref:Uncharacterized protein n=1 Tax=hydrocarbon metagenome TaxID=938273 RepID=A0A0W8FRB5_9ZZZZ
MITKKVNSDSFSSVRFWCSPVYNSQIVITEARKLFSGGGISLLK